MRKDYSAPVITARPAHSTQKGGQQGEQEKKRVDYSHLDIVAEVERIIERRLVRHTRTSGKYKCACPFPGCSSKQDAFLVFDRPVLEESEKHFWCNRCGESGSLIDLLIKLKGYTFKEACADLRIDPRTWRAIDESAGQGEQRRTSTSERRQREAEQRRKAEQKELDMLDAAYSLACKTLAAGQVVIDGQVKPLDQARLYLHERGFTLDQAALLGIGYIPSRQEIGSNPGEQLGSWRGRVLFPMSGPAGARGYAGRSLWRWKPGMTAEQHKAIFDAWNKAHPDKHIARHYKTRQQAFYGYDLACQVRTLICVEGEFDAASVRLALAGVPDIAVVAFGKNFAPRLIPANVLNVILALDVDISSDELKRHFAELEARGLEVDIAVPAQGKDWNECHLLAGLGEIRDEIMRVYRELMPASSPAIRDQGEINKDVDDIVLTESTGETRTIPDGDQVEQSRAAFLAHVQEILDGEVRGAPVWPEPYTLTLLPAGMSSAEYIERWYQGERPGRVVIGPAETAGIAGELEGNQGDQFSAANNRCSRHGRALRYSDEQGGRYCDHIDCWERYRLIRTGAACGYPALSGVVDPRDYLADTSKAPLYHTVSGLPVYPARPVVKQQLIAAGADAWRAYVAGRDYQAIDQAIKALLSEASGTL